MNLVPLATFTGASFLGAGAPSVDIMISCFHDGVPSPNILYSDHYLSYSKYKPEYFINLEINL